MLAGEVLALAARRTPDRTAIVFRDRRLSYRELDAFANRIANALVERGPGRGRVVAMLSPNRAEYPAFLFGAARSGCIQAHMSIRYTVDDLVYVMEKTGTGMVFVHAEMLPRVLEAATRLPGLRRIVVFGGPASAAPAGGGAPEVTTLDDFLEGAPTTPPAVDLSDTDPFAITYTGGTTGFPKAVLVTHRARTLASIGAAKVFGLRETDICAPVTPLFHVAGLFSWYMTCVVVGTTVVLMDAWDPAGFIDLAAREKITAAFMVPTQISGVLNDPGFDREKLKSWRYINYGGSPTPAALLERLYGQFPDMVLMEHYGQSEIGPGCYRPPEMTFVKPDSVGIPFETIELAILDLDGQPVPTGELGEVAVRGPTLLTEYYGDPEATAALRTPDGWVRTGDIGYRDADGYLFLFDRSKDMIISGGENIYPTELENALFAHPAVRECAVFGIPDDHWGEVPAAHVVLHDGQAVSEQALIDHVAGRVARFKRPRMIRFVDALPRTAIGKVQKNVIRAPYWEGRERAI